MPGFADGPDDPLSQYILGVMTDVIAPLLSSCVHMPEDQGMAVVVRFQVEGTTGTGGVLDNVSLTDADGGAIARPQSDCMEQSLLSVILDAPPVGHPMITVEFPFRIGDDGGATLDLSGPGTDEP